jgi:hypothetical protein
MRRPTGIFPGGKVFQLPPPAVEASKLSGALADGEGAAATTGGVVAGGATEGTGDFAIATTVGARVGVGEICATIVGVRAGVGEGVGVAFWFFLFPFVLDGGGEGGGAGGGVTTATFGGST